MPDQLSLGQQVGLHHTDAKSLQGPTVHRHRMGVDRRIALQDVGLRVPGRHQHPIHQVPSEMPCQRLDVGGGIHVVGLAGLGHQVENQDDRGAKLTQFPTQ